MSLVTRKKTAPQTLDQRLERAADKKAAGEALARAAVAGLETSVLEYEGVRDAAESEMQRLALLSDSANQGAVDALRTADSIRPQVG